MIIRLAILFLAWLCRERERAREPRTLEQERMTLQQTYSGEGRAEELRHAPLATC